MWRIGIKPTRVTFNVIINAYAMAADSENQYNREKVMSRVNRGNSRIKAREDFGGRTVGGEMLEKAIGVLEKMREADIAPDTWTYNTLLNACAKSAAAANRSPRKGVRVLELMKEAGLEAAPDQYKLLLETCRHAGPEQLDSFSLGLR